jgi:diaminohydroxyphosphoribosylaminopyrimidine deaminase/5-amino-6-(5-phosphoribosylamino)uracil reductase
MSAALAIAEAAMRRALELAHRGQGRVEPNPAVGAVIVDDSGRTVGEGWHQDYGGPHAEVHALAAAGHAARGATLFVTLEPCCHFGKTPPCTRAVIAAGIRRVVVAMPDPAPHVAGGGLQELRDAGIDVEVGLLKTDAMRLVAPFVILMTRHRPWFHAKWAMTLDGKIASHTGQSRWITNEASRSIVHQLRGRMDGVLVGIGTALADDPQLTARPAGPRIATRIVIDSHARLPANSQLAQTALQVPVLVIGSTSAPEERVEILRAAGIEVLLFEPDSSGHPPLVSVARELGRRRLTNVLIEGGSRLLGGFFDTRLIDEVHTFIAPKLVGGATALTPLSGEGLVSIPVGPSIDEPAIELPGGDIYIHGPVRRDP